MKVINTYFTSSVCFMDMFYNPVEVVLGYLSLREKTSSWRKVLIYVFISHNMTIWKGTLQVAEQLAAEQRLLEAEVRSTGSAVALCLRNDFYDVGLSYET